MNYLAHSLECLDDPYEIAGAAVPDWLGLTRPRLRCRSRHARPWIEHVDPQFAAIARGVVRHHADDDWFHQTPAFGDLTLELARRIRRATGDSDGMRPSFLGHILLELLLDAAVHDDRPELLDRYYDALASVDAAIISHAVATMTGADAGQLTSIIARFCELRFLYDYADDQRLLFRLNQVMRRVGLPSLAEAFLRILPGARMLIAANREELLTPLASLAASEA
jgi:hypothetical protein